MRIHNYHIKDLDGKGILERSDHPSVDPIVMTVANALRWMALQPPREGQPPYTPAQTVERLYAAIQLNKLAIGETVELNDRVAKDLEKAIPSFFAPLVAGQLFLALQGHEAIID